MTVAIFSVILMPGIERRAKMAKQWTLRELAADTGVPERTIRFYISRQLLGPPLKAGRGATYGPKHKARLLEIRELQAKGMMLAEIAHAPALASFRHGEKRATVLHRGSEVGRMVWFEQDGSLDKSCSDLKAETLLAEPAPALPAPVAWRAYAVADDAVVMLRAEAGPWRTKRLLSALRRFAAEIIDENKKEDKGE